MSLASDIEFEADSYDFTNSTDESIFKEYLNNNLFWKTKDGCLIKIENMTVNHIMNCIKMKNKKNCKSWDLVLNFELKKVRKIE